MIVGDRSSTPGKGNFYPFQGISFYPLSFYLEVIFSVCNLTFFASLHLEESSFLRESISLGNKRERIRKKMKEKTYTREWESHLSTRDDVERRNIWHFIFPHWILSFSGSLREKGVQAPCEQTKTFASWHERGVFLSTDPLIRFTIKGRKWNPNFSIHLPKHDLSIVF